MSSCTLGRSRAALPCAHPSSLPQPRLPLSPPHSKFGGFGGDSESFSTAGRSIKAGLTACDIVAKWTWAATLLQSANVAWSFGVSGPFWYAAGESRAC